MIIVSSTKEKNKVSWDLVTGGPSGGGGADREVVSGSFLE